MTKPPPFPVKVWPGAFLMSVFAAGVEQAKLTYYGIYIKIYSEKVEK